MEQEEEHVPKLRVTVGHVFSRRAKDPCSFCDIRSSRCRSRHGHWATGKSLAGQKCECAKLRCMKIPPSLH